MTRRSLHGGRGDLQGARRAERAEAFGFAFAPAYRPAALVFGVTPARARVEMGETQLRVGFGPWRLDTPLSNVVQVAVTGPYRYLKTAGPAHLSLKDRGVTFATNGDRGVCVTFREPVAALAPFGLLRHPGMTVTVAEPDRLIRAMAARANELPSGA